MPHTPRPWTVVPDDEHFADALRVVHKGTRQPVCYAIGTVADAELIAAAPELLAACKAALGEVWDGQLLGFKDALSASVIRDKCRAAIKLAEENQPCAKP